MAKNYGNVSDEAVRNATGKGWDEWIALLDDAGAETMSHKEIAAMLTSDKWLGSGGSWWAQSVTVGYEYAKGRRVKGATADAGFQVGVQKTLSLDAPALWRFMMSTNGLRIWSGDVDEELPLEKGAAYQTRDGVAGEIRSVNPNERLRLTWKPNGWPNESTLQLYFQDKGDRTALLFHHEKLKDADQRAEMKAHWQSVLALIAKAI